MCRSLPSKQGVGNDPFDIWEHANSKIPQCDFATILLLGSGSHYWHG